MGIPVIGFRTDEFPAFYSPSSGLPVDYRAESVEEITEIFVAHRRLKLDSAILVVNPPHLNLQYQVINWNMLFRMLSESRWN